MRGRPIAMRRKPVGDLGGRVGPVSNRRNNMPIRGKRGGEYRDSGRDTGRRAEGREEFRRPVENYDRDIRRPGFHDEGPRDNRRPPPLMTNPRFERRMPQSDFRPGRDNFQKNFAPNFQDSRPIPRSSDVERFEVPKHRTVPYSRESPSNVSQLSPKKRLLEKRPLEEVPRREEDLRKRLKRNARSKSPKTRPTIPKPSRNERPEYRGPEENVQFSREDLRKFQIRITKPETSPPTRRYDEPSNRRPATPEPMYQHREADRGRPRQDHTARGPFREQNQAWDNDIALHRMKNDYMRHNNESDGRKAFQRDGIQRNPNPGIDRREIDSGRVRGGRGQSREHRDRPLSGDRGRYESHTPHERGPEQRSRMLPPRDGPRYADMPPRRARTPERMRSNPGYPPYGREAPFPEHFDYPPRRLPHHMPY